MCRLPDNDTSVTEISFLWKILIFCWGGGLFDYFPPAQTQRVQGLVLLQKHRRMRWIKICHDGHFLFSLVAHNHVDDYSGTLGGVCKKRKKVHISALVKQKSLNCCTVSSSFSKNKNKKDLVDWSVGGAWHKSVNSHRLSCILGERFPRIFCLCLMWWWKKHELADTVSESVAQSKSVPSQKPKLSTINVVTKWMGDHCVLGFAPTMRFPQGQIISRLSFWWDYKLSVYKHVYTHAKRSHTHGNESVVHVKVQWIMETSKTKNKTASTKSVRSL